MPLSLQSGALVGRVAELGSLGGVRPSNMKHHWKLLFGLCIAFSACSGCGTLGTHIPNQSPGVYAGVRADVKEIFHPSEINDGVIGHIPRGVLVPCFIIDLPLSAAMDTLFLPIDLTYRKQKAAAATPPRTPSKK